MVKIPGRFNSPADRNFIPGATYVGDSRLIGLGIFHDQTDHSDVLLRFDGQKPTYLSFSEFSRIVEYLEDFSNGKAGSEMPEPNPMKVSAVLLESSRVHLRWNTSSTALFPLEFFQVLNVLLSAKKRLESMIRRKKEKQAALNSFSFMAQMRSWGSLTVFLLLSALNITMFIGFIFQHNWFAHWLILTICMGIWMIFFTPEWTGKIGPVLKEYINEKFFYELTFVQFPKRAAEIFLAVFICLALYALIGSGAAETIIDFYRRNAHP